MRCHVKCLLRMLLLCLLLLLLCHHDSRSLLLLLCRHVVCRLLLQRGAEHATLQLRLHCILCCLHDLTGTLQ